MTNIPAELGPWFHNIHLPDGTQTAPDHALGDFPAVKWQYLAPLLPADLQGWSVLEIGCNAGFYALQLAQRGASVSGIDVDPRYLAQAQWAAEQFGLQEQIELHHMQVYDLARWERTFDLVLFMGVLYHLRYPLLGLDLVAQKAGRLLVYQGLTIPGEEEMVDTDGLPIKREAREVMHERGWPKMAFVEHTLADDPTNWWVPNHAGIRAMLRSSGLRIIRYVGYETYLCEPNPQQPASVTTWNQAELLAATGRPWRSNEA